MYVAQALGRMGADAAAAVDALQAAARRDGSEDVRREAAIALRRIRGLRPTPS